MSEPINDGGPAFPGEIGVSGYGHSKRVIHDDGTQDWIEIGQGMTLRDYFAAKALQGELASNADYSTEWRNDKNEIQLLYRGSTPIQDGTNWRKAASPTERLCRQCYAYADAMLKARMKQ